MLYQDLSPVFIPELNNFQTLIVVTADHSHAMTMLGYPKRGTDIRGLTGDLAKDGLPEPILGYANGPG